MLNSNFNLNINMYSKLDVNLMKNFDVILTNIIFVKHNVLKFIFINIGYSINTYN